jgi:hypothetical protein
MVMQQWSYVRHKTATDIVARLATTIPEKKITSQTI